MRLTDVIDTYTVVTTEDGYGGIVETRIPTNYTTEITALVSVHEDELKPSITGYGFYRTATIVVQVDEYLEIGDMVTYNGIDYKVVYPVKLKNNHFKAFKAYEV